ncbi:MAG: hypothetical protein IJ571_00595 [Ruminococcus sp.]|nr:hypothetical protein [Ruminococcus sp.]
MKVYKLKLTFPNRLTKICNFTEQTFSSYLGTNDPKVIKTFAQNRMGYSCRVLEVVDDTTGFISSMQDNTLSGLYLAEYIITNCDREYAEQVCNRIYASISEDKCFKGYALTGLQSLHQIEYAIRCKKDYIAHISKVNKSSSYRAYHRFKLRQYAQKRELAKSGK